MQALSLAKQALKLSPMTDSPSTQTMPAVQPSEASAQSVPAAKKSDAEIVSLLMADIQRLRPNLCRSLARVPKSKNAYDRFIRKKRAAFKGYAPGLHKDPFNDEAKCLGCEEVMYIGCCLHTVDERCMCIVLCEECEE